MHPISGVATSARSVAYGRIRSLPCSAAPCIWGTWPPNPSWRLPAVLLQLPREGDLATQRQTAGDVDHQREQNEDERGTPCLLDERGEGSGPVVIDEQWKRLD